MNQFGRFAGSAGGKILTFQYSDLQPSKTGLAQYTRTGYSPAYNDQVKLCIFQITQD
jgi:hypothetical protein